MQKLVGFAAEDTEYSDIFAGRKRSNRGGRVNEQTSGMWFCFTAYKAMLTVEVAEGRIEVPDIVTGHDASFDNPTMSSLKDSAVYLQVLTFGYKALLGVRPDNTEAARARYIKAKKDIAKVKDENGRECYVGLLKALDRQETSNFAILFPDSKYPPK